MIEKLERTLNAVLTKQGLRTKTTQTTEATINNKSTPGLKVIKLEFILKLKLRFRKQPIIALYHEYENELTFYHLEAKITGTTF